jgi:hypothetical protein
MGLAGGGGRAGRAGDRAIVGEQGVTYGLQVRAQSERRKPAAPRAGGVFGDASSDSEGDSEGGGAGGASVPGAAGLGKARLGKARLGKAGKGSTANLVVGKMLARQMAAIDRDGKVKKAREEALREDGSVFDYDVHVDAIQAARREKVEARQQEKVERKSRYIAGLLETAEHRKKEQEVLFEKRLEKEREAEEEVYGTKEKFVTGAYRRKLEEEEKWKLAQEKKREEDEANAVEKRGSMAGFYSNYLNVVSGKAEQAPSPHADSSGAKHATGVTDGGGGDDGTAGAADGAGVGAGEASPSRLAGAVQPEQPEQPVQPVQPVQPEQPGEEPAARAARLKREREEKIAEAKRRYQSRRQRVVHTGDGGGGARPG